MVAGTERIFVGKGYDPFAEIRFAERAFYVEVVFYLYP